MFCSLQLFSPYSALSLTLNLLNQMDVIVTNSIPCSLNPGKQQGNIESQSSTFSRKIVLLQVTLRIHGTKEMLGPISSLAPA